MQDDYITPSPQLKKLRTIILAGISLFVLVGVVWWIYSNAFIHIVVSNPGEGKLKYQIVNQESGDAVPIDSTSNEINQFVPAGKYEVLVTQDETSYYKTIETGSFLSTTTIDAQLQPENFRSFVGNNPRDCMHYNQKLLFSYACDGSFSSLKVHLPASQNTPTIADSPESALADLSIGGVVRINNKSMVLLNGLPNDDEGGSVPVMYELADNLQLAEPLLLSGVTENESYKILNFQEGFVLYSSDLRDVLYYHNTTASPERIEFNPPRNDTLQPFELVTHNDSLAAVYSQVSGTDPDNNQERIANGDETAVTTGSTVFQVYKNGTTKSFTFKGGYTHAKLCGQQELCIINGPQLTVYDISGKEQKALFSINKAADIINDGDTLIVLGEKNVISLDIGSQTGHIQYSYGGYIPCGGGEVSGGGYLVCTAGPTGDQSALFINTKADNEDSIDKKVFSLAKQSYVESVSAYKSYIYVVPNLGEPVYNPETGGFTSDPVRRQKAAGDINSFIKKIDIDQSQYTIINTQP